MPRAGEMPSENRLNRRAGAEPRGKVARVRGMRGTSRFMCVAAGLGALAFAGCGGGTRQDADEPAGNYTVDVVKASFPQSQRLAGQVRLDITVNNAGAKTIPNIAVTVEGADGAAELRDLAEAGDPLARNGEPAGHRGTRRSLIGSP